ncbi:hypothetical protein DPMN_055213 [Dreissena polymorpha]|uniref:Uncharacterized protein n=1 Tax=Dreissena polymorpha TaxID=45954 RepID=A0A9D4CS94_DREPO|nr:hypothetical protein DPMN_055213 [Dreissena polymorpha]
MPPPPPIGSNVFQANIIIFKLIQDIIKTNLLTKFHQDWTINVAFRVLTRFYYSHIKPYKEKCPAPGGHVFKAAKTIFKLIQDIIGTNLLTKFHDDQKINVTSRVLTRKIAPPPWWPYIGMNFLTKKNVPPLGGHVFQENVTVFELIQDIIKTNLLTIFHQDWTINVASRVLRKNAPPPGGHVYQPTSIIFKLVQDIIGMNLLTKFHEDRTINVASRVKNAPPLGSHVFQAKFHKDQKINVASRVLTRKNVPPPGGHVFQPTSIIFKLVQDIVGMNLLTKFHEDRTINMASRVLTRKIAPPPGGHVFQQTGIIFEIVQDIIGMNLLTKVNWPIEKNAPPLGSHVFQAKVTIFELIQDTSGTNLLSKFHEDRKINVASRVLTRKNAPPPGGHVFQPTGIIFKLVQDIIGMNLLTNHVFRANVTIFELIQDIIKTKLLTKFHEDLTINVASRELTRQMLTPHNGQRTTDKKRSQKLTMSTLCSGELKTA